MPKEITLIQTLLEVFPNDYPDPANPEVIVESKKFLFFDPATGETMTYKMTKDLVEETARKLKMSNKSLVAHHEERQRQQATRNLLAGGNGGPNLEEQKIAEDILKGIHKKENRQ